VPKAGYLSSAVQRKPPAAERSPISNLNLLKISRIDARISFEQKPKIKPSSSTKYTE
jgi:hypothetical protein